MSETAATGSTSANTGKRVRKSAGADAALAGGRSASSIDIATVAGLIGGLLLIVGAMFLSGSVGGFIDVPAMLIVVLGTIAVTSISFSIPDILGAQKVMLKSIVNLSRDPGDTALSTLQIAERARQDGVLSLQNFLDEGRGDPFLIRGLGLVIDGAPAQDAEAVMRTEMHAIAERHNKGADILRRAAEVAPAMGLIGTLVGLVQMLGNLSDPSAIGPAMAVALLTTFYGAVLGNMVFSPLASKLERKSDEEALLNEIYLLAITSIARQEHPRRLEVLLNTILPPAKRISYFG
ncbi:MAG: MotA/TolQ/ExbB proton channel family protein [Alphaproteobacteria bacterium]|nr:MotA/TolQ/ExbB proton channel family protein [Alphaproteobacteria bacterium]